MVAGEHFSGGKIPRPSLVRAALGARMQAAAGSGLRYGLPGTPVVKFLSVHSDQGDGQDIEEHQRHGSAGGSVHEGQTWYSATGFCSSQR